jgi:hypothetical protein
MKTTLIFEKENETPFFTSVEIITESESDLYIILQQIADANNDLDILYFK